MNSRRFLVLLLAVTLLTAAVPLFAADDTPRAAGTDIVRMWNARVSGDTIVLFVRQSDLVFTADDIATMAEAGLPDRFIRQLLKEANRRDDDAYQTYYPRYDPYYYGSPYPWWFYGGHTVLDLHLGGHFGGHHYGSIGHGYSPIGHRGGATRHSGGSHGFLGSHRGSGHVSRGHSGGHSSGGHSSGGHSSGGHRSGGGRHGGH